MHQGIYTRMEETAIFSIRKKRNSPNFCCEENSLVTAIFLHSEIQYVTMKKDEIQLYCIQPHV